MKTIRKFWLQIFPKYRRLETKFVSYRIADQMIRHTAEEADESKRWQIAKEEDDNRVAGYVHLERRERITS